MIFSAWAVSAVMWPPLVVAWPYIEGERTVPANDCYIQFIYSNEYVSIGTIFVAFFAPVSIMCGLYVRVWWETVKRQKDLVNLQAAGKRSVVAPKSNSKRSDSRRVIGTTRVEIWRSWPWAGPPSYRLREPGAMSDRRREKAADWLRKKRSRVGA